MGQVNILKVINGTLHAYRSSQYTDFADALSCGGVYSMSDDNEWTYTKLTDTMITVRNAADMMEHQADIKIYMQFDDEYIPAEQVQNTYFLD